MSGENSTEPFGKSSYARKRKTPYRYSSSYQEWKHTGDARAHDREFLDQVKLDNRGGKKRYERDHS